MAAPKGTAAAGGGAASASGYPPLRRAQRLVYQLASLLVDSFDVGEGRQVTAATGLPSPPHVSTSGCAGALEDCVSRI